MREAFTILYSRIVLEALLAIGVVALVLSRLRRRLRVSPGQRSHAPVLWLVNITADARLHRRLRRLAKRARSAATGGVRHRRRHGISPSQRLAFDLESEVVNLHEKLLGSRRLGYDGQMVVVKQVRSDADRIDTLLDRTIRLIETEATDPSSTVAPDPIGAIATRLDQLEAAVDDHAAGVIETTGTSDTQPTSEPTALDSPT